MSGMFSKRSVRGQSLIEYTSVIGIIVVIILAVTPLIKRSIQAMIKTTADQIGNQEEAEQRTTDVRGGFLQSSDSITQVTSDVQTVEEFGVMHHVYDETTKTDTLQKINQGYTQTK